MGTGMTDMGNSGFGDGETRPGFVECPKCRKHVPLGNVLLHDLICRPGRVPLETEIAGGEDQTQVNTT